MRCRSKTRWPGTDVHPGVANEVNDMVRKGSTPAEVAKAVMAAVKGKGKGKPTQERSEPADATGWIPKLQKNQRNQTSLAALPDKAMAKRLRHLQSDEIPKTAEFDDSDGCSKKKGKYDKEETPPEKSKKKDKEEDEEIPRRKSKKNDKEEDEEIPRRKSKKNKEDEEIPPKSGKKKDKEEDEEVPPKKSKKNDKEEDEEVPPKKSKKKDKEEDEEIPSKKSKKNKEDEEIPPKKSKKKDKEEDEEIPRRKSKKNNKEEDEEIPPKKNKKKGKEEDEEKASGKRTTKSIEHEVWEDIPKGPKEKKPKEAAAKEVEVPKKKKNSEDDVRESAFDVRRRKMEELREEEWEDPDAWVWDLMFMVGEEADAKDTAPKAGKLKRRQLKLKDMKACRFYTFVGKRILPKPSIVKRTVQLKLRQLPTVKFYKPFGKAKKESASAGPTITLGFSEAKADFFKLVDVMPGKEKVEMKRTDTSATIHYVPWPKNTRQ